MLTSLFRRAWWSIIGRNGGMISQHNSKSQQVCTAGTRHHTACLVGELVSLAQHLVVRRLSSICADLELLLFSDAQAFVRVTRRIEERLLTVHGGGFLSHKFTDS